MIRLHLNTIAMGTPPSLWITAGLLSLSVYLLSSSQFMLTSLLSVEVFAGRKNNIRFILFCDFMGSILSLLVAPIIDNYKQHFHVTVAGLLVCSLTPAVALIFPSSGKTWISPFLAMSVVAQFFGPSFIAFAMLQLSDRIGKATSLYFSILLTASYAVAALIHVFVFWGRTYRLSPLIFTIVFIAITFVLFNIFILTPKSRFYDGNYEPGATRQIFQNMCKTISPVARSKKTQDQEVKLNSKITAKILLILITLSLNMSVQQDFSRLWASQYWRLAPSGLFSVMDYNELWLALTAILVPLAHFSFVPLLQRRGLPVSVYSFGMGVGYLFCCLTGIATLVIQRHIVGPRLTNSNSWLLLINTQSTDSYVRAEEEPAVNILAGSVKLFEIEDFGTSSTVFAIFNFFHGTSEFVELRHELGKASVYVLACSGDTYLVPANNTARSVVPSVNFICPIDIETGKFQVWCNATVTLLSNKPSYFQTVDLLEVGNGSSIELPTDVWLNVKVDFKGVSHCSQKGINFNPLAGGKYFFIIWRSDVDLKVKYLIVTAYPPYRLNSNVALLQILSRALAVALTQVPLLTVIHINAPAPVVATLWSVFFLSSKLLTPVPIILEHFNIKEITSQLFLTCLNAILFLIYLVTLRIAKYM